MRYFIFIFCLILASCNNAPTFDFPALVSRIKKCNLEILQGVRIEARIKSGDRYLTNRFTVRLNESNYDIPNFEYQTHLSEVFDPRKFADAKGISELEANFFVRKFSLEVMSSYDCTGVYRIRGDFDNGKVILFFLDSEHFIFYAPNPDSIQNEFYRKMINPINKIEDGWYVGRY